MLYKAEKNCLVAIVARSVPWRKYGTKWLPVVQLKLAVGIFSGG